MDKMELRKVIFKKAKKELNKFIDIFSEKCPHFSLKMDLKKSKKDVIAYKLWVILLNLSSNYPNEGDICLSILSNESQIENPSHNIESSDTILVTVDVEHIPFMPDNICKLLYNLYVEDKEFMKNWRKDREFLGFSYFLASNDLCIPPDLEKMLYNRLFQENIKFEYGEGTLLDYSRYQVENWEKELKKVLTELSNSEISIIFSLNLLYYKLISLLETKNVKIIYNFDDIPLLKRVILAQLLKLDKNGACPDENLEDLAELLNDVMDFKVNNTNIKILPWSELD